VNSVLSDLDVLPDLPTREQTPVSSDANANDAIIAEIEKLKSTNELEEVQTQWNEFTTKLASDYPQVANQIQQLNTITISLSTIEQWKTFFDLVSEKIIQLQQTSTSTTDAATSTTHTATNEDLEWLFDHRNSHDNQATW
jgi:DNA-binding ferritin-like protein